MLLMGITQLVRARLNVDTLTDVKSSFAGASWTCM